MANVNNFLFLNHASFAIERNSQILLIDPWFQGMAFYDGWALLDQSTTNFDIIQWLKLSNKKIFIWYSHEHSDHLSMSFLKDIQKENINLTIIFQKTLDGRVSSFLRNHEFNVIDAIENKPVQLGENFSITTWCHHAGDSFCLIKSNKISILNINDCVVSSENEARILKRKISTLSSHIDILLTQFGYANWIGNEEDKKQRIKSANLKCDRIFIQDKVLKPSVIIPFASFFYFCHPENFYLNDAQNLPKDLIAARVLNPIKEKIFFLKSRDQISLDNINLISYQLSRLSITAIEHWSFLQKKIAPIQTQPQFIKIQNLKELFHSYRKRVSFNFVFLPQFLEFFKIIVPLNILITDINKVVTLSYIRGFNCFDHSKDWHISLTSEIFSFIFKNDFGSSTIHINGRFRLGQNKKIIDIIKFLIIQDLYKSGFGIKHPIASAKFLLGEIIIMLKKKSIKKT
jgi:UDP-MurNAc hydroxylase